jgi:protease-4
VRGGGGLDPWTGEVFLGADDLAEDLRDLADDDDVRAVVLRIDSPGGSALASDLMLREVERLRRAKPVVVSMSDVAASGGYYIASRATAIVAEAGTLTGSIGVVSGKFVTSGFERELLGISRDPLQRGANAGIYAPRERFTPAQAERLAAQMAHVYDTFVGHVAEGRKLSREKVDAVAQGRLWTGEEALRVGLVDALGGLDVAVARAREAAQIAAQAEVRIRFVPAPSGLLELLFSEERRGEPLSLEALAARLAPAGPALELPRAWRRLAAPW